MRKLLSKIHALATGRMARLGKPFPHLGGNLHACIAYNRFGGYCVPVSAINRPAAHFIQCGEVWEEETVEFIRANCKHGDVIHAGTFFGDMLPPIAQALEPQATLWAFEPHPVSFRCASITRELNGLENVRLCHAGLSDKAGPGRLTIKRAGVELGGESRILQSGDEASSVPIKLVAIDDVVPAQHPVSIIHLDVEDYEQIALTGALQTIRRCKPIIIVETLPAAGWLASNLRDYRVTHKINENTVLQTG